MKLSEKIKQLRNGANLTQLELAQAAGIEQSYLSKSAFFKAVVT
jgi:transcriptional regulator with XRE-family HTH domain